MKPINYGQVTTEKYREGKVVNTVTKCIEYIEVANEADALTHFISFVRECRDNKYGEPSFKLVTDKKTGDLRRIMREYSVAVDTAA